MKKQNTVYFAPASLFPLPVSAKDPEPSGPPMWVQTEEEANKLLYNHPLWLALVDDILDALEANQKRPPVADASADIVAKIIGR